MNYISIVVGSLLMVVSSLATGFVWRFISGAIVRKLYHSIVATAAYRVEASESLLLAGALLILAGIAILRFYRL